jgi:SAM-dependent MidA family methyltransferase
VQSNTTHGHALPEPAPPSPTLPSGLPPPDPGALAHGRRVAAHIGAEIRRAGGWIPFSAFMRMALYAPGLGYYAAGAKKFGAQGDFVTAPELSPLFGHALANQLAEVLRATGGCVLELGAGTGCLAADVLLRFGALEALPESYAILEPSPDLRERQQQTLRRLPPELSSRVLWVDALPGEWTGVIFGNEVLDALPIELLARRGTEHLRRGVTLDATGRFAWRDAPLTAGAHYDAIDTLFPAGDYESEINPEAEALTATIARSLRRGLLLWIDYGFPAREYYHPQRTAGTLMCHYRQLAHSDPLLLTGLQDITAHVNFSAIAQAGLAAGLELAGYTAQAGFLLNCGIADLLQEAGDPGTAKYLRHSNAVQRLLSPAEMGELFKVIAFTRDLDQPLRGFAAGDRSGRL